jgi:nucleotide-binding universal stress UspA family protein
LADGERLLAEAQAVQADWLVVGAYRRNRLVEWVLGGITRTVLDQARLPVFMKH